MTHTVQYEVLATLHGHEGWVWDGDVVARNEAYSAEFWFDGGTPRLEFDHFIAGHLELTQDEHNDAKAILREIDIEVARWLDERHEMKGCVDPDHGIGDHPCDEVLGKEAAAAARSGDSEDLVGLDGLIKPEHEAVTIFAINRFGSGEGHPLAEPHNVKFFTLRYARECLRNMATNDKVKPAGVAAAQAALEALA